MGSRELSVLQVGGRKLGLTTPLRTAGECKDVLDSLISIATEFPPGEGQRELVLLIDEFQRVGELTPNRKRLEVCDSVHLLFNTHPQNFRLVLAFAGGLPGVVDEVLTEDLQHRVLSRLDYAPLTPAEGVEYVAELLACYADVPPEDRFRPFDQEAVEYLVSIADPSGDSLSPRDINITFDKVTNAVLDARDSKGIDPEKRISLIESKDAAASV